MKNTANPFKQIAIFSVAVFLASLFILSIPAAAKKKKSWDGVVHASLKTAKPFDWSAPDEFFSGSVKMGTPFRYSVFWEKKRMLEAIRIRNWDPASSGRTGLCRG